MSIPNLIAIAIDDNTKIYIEAISDDINNNGKIFLNASSGASGKVFEKAKDYLDEKMLQVKAFVNSVARTFEAIENKPDAVELEFTIKFASEAGVIISSVGSEAGIKVKLKWSKQEYGKNK